MQYSKSRESIGYLEIDNGIRLIVSFDFIKYYRQLIYLNRPWLKTQFPAHKAHITIVNPKIHGEFDYSELKDLVNKKYKFIYHPERLYESKVNFWIPVETDAYSEVKNRVGFKESDNWWGLHLTVCNRKFNS